MTSGSRYLSRRGIAVLICSVCFCLAGMPALAAAPPQAAPYTGAAEVKGAPDPRPSSSGPVVPGLHYAPKAILGQGYLGEVEPNGTTATATPIVGSNVVVRANLFPNGDIDFYSF